MQILKKSVFLALTLALTNVSFAQLNEFAKSYQYEYYYKYDSAIFTMQKIYVEDDYAANLRLGWLFYLAGRHQASVSYYQKAIALMPASVQPLWGILSPLSKLENWVEVEKTYLQILKLDPKNSQAHYKLGLIYFYRKEYPKAKSYFDVSLNLYPFDFDILSISGWTNYYLGNFKDATILFKKAQLVKPSDTSVKEGLNLMKQ